MSDEVKMREEKIKNDWAKIEKRAEHPRTKMSLVGKYKVGEFKYYDNKSKKYKSLELASIVEARALCGGKLHTELFYDKGSGNFHFAPSETSLGIIKDNIQEKLNECLGDVSPLISNRRNEFGFVKPGSYIIHQDGCMKNLGEDYETYVAKIFSYVGLTTVGDVKYELTGVRFSKEKAEERVSCDIGAIQMMRIPSGYHDDDKEFKSVEYYPDTIENHGEIEKFLENRGKDKKEYFYYNPELTIYDNVEKIAEKFIDFIINCEEKYKDK